MKLRYIKYSNFIRRRKRIFGVFLVVLLIYLILPIPGFNDPASTVLYSREGRLLGAKIAKDEQWRFPAMDSVPEKFSQALIQFEDRWFYYHPGFNPVSFIRAIILNIKHRKIVSGGSTISMQVIRLMRKGKPRTIWEKFIEIWLATRLELKYSKQEILALYASHAPFGGNVVGLEAAAWRYFGRAPDNLSWGETTALAVLPNAPSLVFPGRNEEAYRQKRNRLLKKLLDREIIDSISYMLAIRENLPSKPKSLPAIAPHLLERVRLEMPGKKVHSSLDYNLQVSVNELVARRNRVLMYNEIYNAAALVLNSQTGEILCYVGNTKSINNEEHGNDVDIITAERSSGSILKPFLYASMINDGDILEQTLVPDIPTFMEGFSPKNYDLTYSGAVPASKALSQSLNVPAVHLLSEYTVGKFQNFLRNMGFTSLRYPADHYGLSLILGGGEVSLWELCGAYASMSRILSQTVKRNYTYCKSDIREPHFYYYEKLQQKTCDNESKTPLVLSAASIWKTFQALLEVNRPETERGWEFYSSSHKIAWKTGTSFGFRDAWAVGITPDYIVGIWVGNASGEGRPGITGVTAAAPIMFDIFHILEPSKWFEEPYDEFIEADVCKQSGMLASPNCTDVIKKSICEPGINTIPCKYHKIVHLDKTSQFRVNSECFSMEEIKSVSWFVLPPTMEYYYRQKHPLYKILPPYKINCRENQDILNMEFIYPRHGMKIYIPLDLDGTRSEVVFEIAHRQANAEVYWHMDEEYIGKTTRFHQISLIPTEGLHTVTAVDQDGQTISRRFEIVSKRE